MKYSIDDWVWYTMFPQLTHFKDDKIRAVVLELLEKDIIYDYRIYLDDGTSRVKKVKEENLAPLN